MKNIFLLFLIFISSATSFAQKKMIPVTQSALTGIALPAGSFQDKRILSESVAKTMLDIESEKTGRIISSIEVFVIPPFVSSGFDEDTLVNELSELGWEISVSEGNKKYAWLQKENQSVIVYFSNKTKEIKLYFGLDSSSSQSLQSNDFNNEQTASVQNTQNQETVDSSNYTPVEFSGQKETFDIVTYSPPIDWKKEVKENIISYSIVNNIAKTWCQIGIVKSTNSIGSIEQDFMSEWRELVANQYDITAGPQTSEVYEEDGWKIQSGSGQFNFNNNKAAVILTAFSGHGRCVSVIATTGSGRYLNDIESFVSHIELTEPYEQQLVSDETKTISTQPTLANGFSFTTTNFDDGWVANVKEDWVEVIKGNIKVLIHYPNKQADSYNSVVLDGLKNAWDILVAPRYSAASNMEFLPITGWQTIEFAEADMTEKFTNNLVHVVFFKMNYSNGSGKYLEFITPNKQTFENEFGPYHQTISGWEKMENMANYNKFAVSQSDLKGRWTSDFTGAIQYVNAYTGYDAGMNTNASTENFYFEAGNAYKWDLAVANGMVGNIKFQSVKSNGVFTMPNNWQVNFSDMEGKPRMYNVYFSCIKNLRVLWLQDTNYGDYKGYAKVE
jgi:hypothetical protein